MSQTSLIATLGGQPQVVTFALDALLAQHEPIEAVYLLHVSTRQPRIRRSLTLLSQEFAGNRYQDRPCHLHRVPLRAGNTPLEDIRNESEAEATWQTVRDLIVRLKHGGHKLHLCVAGGRRMIGLLTMSAAALLCDHHDRVWHIYTPDEFQARARDGAILHAQPGDSVQLIQVPLVPWGTYFPGLRAMAQAPQAAIAQQMGWLAGNEHQCQQVWDELTERQRTVLRAFARGQSPQDVAEALTISLSTVNSHKTAILDACRNAWHIAPDARLDYHFVRERFGPFMRRLEGE